MAPAGKEYRFVARLEHLRGRYFVRIPERVTRDIGRRGNVPVVATVRGRAGSIEVRASLVPLGGGRHRLALNTTARKAMGAEVGASLRIVLRVDHAPAAEPIPEDLALALAEAGVSGEFVKMPVGRQNHILAWVDKAAREETRARRVAKTVEVVCAWREGAKGWW
ncbi:MAG TPA: YdeI/OmpD-associated family protein [Polyangiaceae bacterium]|nr:YdeI/OmpD-associated family protein [Polyangiaceae bacterium]